MQAKFLYNFGMWRSAKCGDARDTEKRGLTMNSKGEFGVYREKVTKRRTDDSPEGEMGLGAEAANIMSWGREEAKRSRREDQMDE